MHYEGVVIGLSSFLVIGLFHPIVIKAEYYFSKKIWPLFLLVGIGFVTASLLIDHCILSAVTGITGFTCLWSIKELHEQEARVKKGWFPQNPKR